MDVSGLFASFNARVLEPWQVAQTFVPPSQFFDLVSRSHSLVIGPRGSGKTTLLKMLHVSALGAWRHPDADSVRSRVDYTGAFVGTDINWISQLAEMQRLGFEPQQSKLLVRALFTSLAIRSLVDAVLFRVGPGAPEGQRFRPLDLDPLSEQALARDLANVFNLDLKVASLIGVRSALGLRLSEVYAICSRESLIGADGRSERLAAIPFLHIGFVAGLSACLDCIEERIPTCVGERWALLLDEMELAPKFIVQELLSALRSVDDRLLFKISVSPYDHELAAMLLNRAGAAGRAGMPGNDFLEINLTYANKDDALDFAERLFLSLAHGRGHVVSDSEAILGRSGIDTDPLTWAGQQTAYRSSSRHGRLLLRYADKDSTFRSFLASAGIDLRRLETLRGPDRAKTVRKMAQVVPLRDAFRTADDVASVTGRRVRSRKQAPVFAGSRGFYAMTEGNPRWIIGIGNKLLDRADSKGRVSPSVQSTEIGAAANRFRALLRTLSFPDSGGRGFLKTLDTLGEYVHQRVVLDPFTIDPIGSFIVDSHPPSWLERWVETALYVGAIVHVPSKNDVSLLTSIRGKRFRLAYIFSPGYGIPVSLGRGVSLLKALESSGSSAVLPEAQPLFSRSDESC